MCKKLTALFLFLTIIYGQDAIEVTPQTLDFGNVLMGNTPTQTFTLECNLDQTISITPPSYYSVDIAEIEMVSGTTQDIVVTFDPPQVGNFDSQIVLAGSTFGNAIVSVNATAVNNLEGSLSGIITAEFSPYEISDDISVELGNTLEIRPGVEFHFMGDYSFKIDGKLDAIGKPDSIIKFIGYNDLVWGGLMFTGLNNSISYTMVEDVGNTSSFPGYDINFESNYGTYEAQHFNGNTYVLYGIQNDVSFSPPNSFGLSLDKVGSYNGLFHSSYIRFESPVLISSDSKISFELYRKSIDGNSNGEFIEIEYRFPGGDWMNTLLSDQNVGPSNPSHWILPDSSGKWINYEFMLSELSGSEVEIRIEFYKYSYDGPQSTFNYLWYVDDIKVENIGRNAILIDGGNLSMSNSAIANSSNAIVINNSYGSQFFNNVITSNYSHALYLNKGTTFFANSIIFDNSQLFNFSPIYIYNGIITFTHSLIDLFTTSGITGSFNDNDGNFEADPVFEGSDYHLNTIYSPAIDAGYPNDHDERLPPGAGTLAADIGMYGGMNNCGASESNLGGGEPSIIRVQDLPQDQGGLVGIQFDGSFYDGSSDVYNIIRYSFWRELTPDRISDVSFENHPNGYFLNTNQRTGEYWEYIGESPAQGFQSYGYTATTLADSNHHGQYWSRFLVVAHTNDESVYFISEPDSGYSVDNLNPDPAENLSMTFNGNHNLISWDISETEDYLFTQIARDGEIISEVYNQTSYMDTELSLSEKYSYIISHVDENGNLSTPENRELHTPDWLIQIETQSNVSGVSNTNFYFAGNDSASIELDPFYDILAPPAPPGNYLRIVSQQNINGNIEDYSYVSVDPLDLSLYTRSINLSGTSDGVNDPDGVNDQVLVNAYLHGLENIDFKISLDNGGYFTPTTIDSNEVITKQFSMYFNDNDSTSLELILGNQGLGQPTFANFNQIEVYHGGSQDVIVNTSGVSSATLTLKMYDGLGNSFTDTLGTYYNLNSVLDTFTVDLFSGAEEDNHSLRKNGYIPNALLKMDYTYSGYDYTIESSEFTVITDTITHLLSNDWEIVHPYFGNQIISSLIENSTDSPYSAYSFNEENSAYEIINFSDIVTESATSFWLKVENPDSSNDTPLSFYGSSPEINSTLTKTIRNFPSWSLSGSSVRPVAKDSLLVRVFESSSFSDLTWAEAVEGSFLLDHLYGVVGDEYSDISTTQVFNGFWIGAENQDQSIDSIKIYFPIHKMADSHHRDELFEYGVRLNNLSLGYNILSNDGKDSRDVVSPPNTPTDKVFIKSFHPEWNYSLGDNFLSDIKNQLVIDVIGGELIVNSCDEFPIRFYNSGEITLNTELVSLPNGVDVMLSLNGDIHDLSENQNLIITVGDGYIGQVIIGNSSLLKTNSSFQTPQSFSVSQNYPNPFNPTTEIKFSLPEKNMVTITVYDVVGRIVKNLMHKNQDAGNYSVFWDATNNNGDNVSAGMYMYSVQAGEKNFMKKMVYLK